MGDWWPALFGVFIGLVLLRAVAIRRLRVGDGRLAPFLVGPTVLLAVLPLLVLVAAAPSMGLLAIPIVAPLALISAHMLRGLVRIIRAGRSGNAETLSQAIGDALYRQVLLDIGVILIGGLVALVVLVVVLVARAANGG